MRTSNLLAQLAVAGIAAGMISVSTVSAEEMASPSPDSAKTAPVPKKSKKRAAKKDTVSVVTPGASSEAGGAPSAVPAAPKGASVAGTGAASASSDKHGCKGLNNCKGQGGCAMSDKDLQGAAKKMGKPIAEAGKAHGCKGGNECKGLGGCKMN